MDESEAEKTRTPIDCGTTTTRMVMGVGRQVQRRWVNPTIMWTRRA